MLRTAYYQTWVSQAFHTFPGQVSPFPLGAKHSGIRIYHALSWYHPLPTLYPVPLQRPLSWVCTKARNRPPQKRLLSPLCRGIYSWYFLIPKAGGGLRPIVVLQNLTKCIKKIKWYPWLWLYLSYTWKTDILPSSYRMRAFMWWSILAPGSLWGLW